MQRQAAPTRKIARKLIFYLISASALLTVFITLYQLYLDYDRDITSIDKRFEQIEKVNLDLISLALWETDNYELKLQLRGMFSLPDVQYLALSEKGQIVLSIGEKKSVSIISKTYPLMYKYRGVAQSIGSLEVVATLDDVYKRLIDKVWIIFISNAVKTFIIAGFMLFIFQRLVTRHINDLARQVAQADVNNLSSPMVLQREKVNPDDHDEFDVLINAFDIMRHKISDSVEHIQRREESLRLYEKIMATTTDLMSYIDLDYNYRAINDAYLDFYQCSRGQIIGEHVSELLGTNYFDEHVKPNLEKTFAGEHVVYISKTTGLNGEEIDIEENYYPYYGDKKYVQGAVVNVRDISFRQQAEKDKLRNIQVYQALAQHGSIHFNTFLISSLTLLQGVFNSKMAFVGRLLPGGKEVKTECVLDRTTVQDNFIYELSNTPCEHVIESCDALVYKDAANQFTQDKMLTELQIESYFGVSLINTFGKVIGILVILDTQAHSKEDWHTDTLSVFAARIAAEMERADALAKLENYNDELAQQVYTRTVELQESINELESFSYSVSHDLRTPLRAINGFSQILLDDNKEALGEEGVKQLNRICTASTKMGELIDSLLKLSRINRQPLEYSDVDLSRLANELLYNHNLDSTHEISAIVEENIHCYCDPGLIRVAIANLIDNAIKYSVNNGVSKIEIGTLQDEGETIYFVKDNGVGFDERHAQKLFVPFQRLHENSEFHGLGIGLATVQRIFHRHGGAVWAESTIGQGATFYFKMGELSRAVSA